jgi:hypothetical protein
LKQGKLVRVVSEESMEGSDRLEKRLNAYLTRRFVLCQNVPADECLDEAREIIEMVQRFQREGR